MAESSSSFVIGSRSALAPEDVVAYIPLLAYTRWTVDIGQTFESKVCAFVPAPESPRYLSVSVIHGRNHKLLADADGL